MKSKFKYRFTQAELLDSPDVPTDLLISNLKELDFLNRHTGGHALSSEGVFSLIGDKSKAYHIVDLGCGSGDWLRYVAGKARKEGLHLKLTGVDKHPDAINYLEQQSKGYPEIDGYTGDYREFMKHASVDVYHCSLFCHHLSNDEMVKLLAAMYSTAQAGFVINDLQRTPLAYYGARAFTFVFRGSDLSRHDGPVSVLRGFTREELIALLHEAGISNHTVHKRHFFRFLVTGRTPAIQNNINSDKFSNYGS